MDKISRVRIKCPYCSHLYSIDPSLFGSGVRCSSARCGYKFLVGPEHVIQAEPAAGQAPKSTTQVVGGEDWEWPLFGMSFYKIGVLLAFIGQAVGILRQVIAGVAGPPPPPKALLLVFTISSLLLGGIGSILCAVGLGLCCAGKSPRNPFLVVILALICLVISMLLALVFLILVLTADGPIELGLAASCLGLAGLLGVAERVLFCQYLRRLAVLFRAPSVVARVDKYLEIFAIAFLSAIAIGILLAIIAAAGSPEAVLGICIFLGFFVGIPFGFFMFLLFQGILSRLQKQLAN